MKFMTAASPVTATKRHNEFIQPSLILDASTLKLPVRQHSVVNVARKAPNGATQQSESASVTEVAENTQPTAGMYFVIGSFRNFGNAQTLASRHGTLLPAVLAARHDGAPVYRVVVGPAVPGREKFLHRRIAKMGLRDTWAIRVQPGDWSIASKVIQQEARETPHSELAQSRQ